MTDPPRLRDLPGGDDGFARDLLRGAEPSRAFTAADAARLKLAVTKAGAAAGAGAASSSGWFVAKAAAPKVLAAVMAVGAGAAAVRAAHRAPAPAAHVTPSRPDVRAPAVPARRAARQLPEAPAAPAPEAVAAPEVAPAPVVAEAPVTTPPDEAAAPSGVQVRVAAPRPERVPVAVASPATAAPAEPPAPARPALTEEVRVIDEAHAAMRDDPSRAARLLADAVRATPCVQMCDERDALLVEALVRSGRVDDARARAAVLLQRSPRSPQSDRVRALLDDAP